MTLGNKLTIKILVKGIQWYCISFSVLYLISGKFSLPSLSLSQLADFMEHHAPSNFFFFFFFKKQSSVKMVRRYELNLPPLFWQLCLCLGTEHYVKYCLELESLASVDSGSAFLTFWLHDMENSWASGHSDERQNYLLRNLLGMTSHRAHTKTTMNNFR